MDPKKDVAESCKLTAKQDGFLASPQLSKFQINGKKLKGILKDFLQQPPQAVTLTLHRYQAEAALATQIKVKEDIASLIRQNGQNFAVLETFLIIAPTGSGKSGIISMLPYLLQVKKALLITPSKNISLQNEKSFFPVDDEKCFFEISGMQTILKKLEDVLETPKVVTCAKEINNFRQLGNLVIVTAQRFGGKAQTSLVHKNKEVIENVEEFFKRFELLIVDEAHHYPAKTWEKIVEQFQNPAEDHHKIVIFLTATPYRNGPKGNSFFILGEGKESRIAYEVTPAKVEGAVKVIILNT